MKEEKWEEKKTKLSSQWSLDPSQIAYFIFTGEVSNQAYSLNTSQIRMETSATHQGGLVVGRIIWTRLTWRFSVCEDCADQSANMFL